MIFKRPDQANRENIGLENLPNLQPDMLSDTLTRTQENSEFSYEARPAPSRIPKTLNRSPDRNVALANPPR